MMPFGMQGKLVQLRAVEGADAGALFPLVHGTSVTDTICWDGPRSLEELQAGLSEREKQVKAGERHQWTILERSSGGKIGSTDLRPYADGPFRGDMGIWIGSPFHGRGYATEAVNLVVAHGFEKLGMEKIEAKIFVGNWASRRAFEKAGFRFEGTIRSGAPKRGVLVD